MKDFDKRILELGKWIYKQGKHSDLPPTFVLNTPLTKDKPRCGGEYPYCDRYMLITYHTLTNSKAQPGTARIQCRNCLKGGIVDMAQWREDVAKSKKSE